MAHSYSLWWGVNSARAVACGTEALAGAALIEGDVRTALAWHLMASLIAGVLGSRCGAGGSSRRVYQAVVASVLASSLPGVGIAGVLWVVLPIWSRSEREPAPDLRDLPVGKLDGGARVAAIAALLVRDRALTIDERVYSLLATRGMSGRVAVPRLQAALAESRDEVRLLAHAMLERRERALRRRIERARRGLALAEVDAQRSAAQRELAHAYIELVEEALVTGELARSAMTEASELAQAAIAVSPDASMYELLARVCLRRLDGHAARGWLERAERAGCAPELRAPLYAEAAFLMRQFDQVRHWLRSASPVALERARIAAAVQHWLNESRNSDRGGPRTD